MEACNDFPFCLTLVVVVSLLLVLALERALFCGETQGAEIDLRDLEGLSFGAPVRRQSQERPERSMLLDLYFAIVFMVLSFWSVARKVRRHRKRIDRFRN